MLAAGPMPGRGRGRVLPQVAIEEAGGQGAGSERTMATGRGRGLLTDYKDSDPFYHREAWKRVRRLALQRDGGMCQDCMDRLRAGYGIKPHRAQMVHHIIPLEERPDLGLDLDNLRSLCNECHNKKHPEKGRQAGKKDAPAIHNRMRVIKV